MSAVMDDQTHRVRPLRNKPISHRLLQPIMLPLSPLTQISDHWLHLLGVRPIQLRKFSDRLVEAILHHYFIDADGREWQAAWDWIGSWAIDGALCEGDIHHELLGCLHRLIRDTVGPLMPSYQYQYQVERDTLILIPSMPTIESYEERIREMSNPDEGWIPPRQRR